MRIHNNLSKRHATTSWLAAKAKTAKDNRIVAAQEKTATAKAKSATDQHSYVQYSTVRTVAATAMQEKIMQQQQHQRYLQ